MSCGHSSRRCGDTRSTANGRSRRARPPYRFAVELGSKPGRRGAAATSFSTTRLAESGRRLGADQAPTRTKPVVRMRGLEPPRPYGHTDLNRARLPIPPHPRAPSVAGGASAFRHARGLPAPIRWRGVDRPASHAARARVPGRDRARGRRPDGWRRPLPGRRQRAVARRADARSAAPARVRRAERAARRRHHPRASDQDEGDDMSYSDTIRDVIEGSDVAIFMKGTPQFVMCGNSDRALQALRRAGAPVTAVDVLPDPQIRQELTAISGWPTIPQVFVKGELVGGADIVEELEASGELGETLRTKLGDDFAGVGDDRTVALA